MDGVVHRDAQGHGEDHRGGRVQRPAGQAEEAVADDQRGGVGEQAEQGDSRAPEEQGHQQRDDDEGACQAVPQVRRDGVHPSVGHQRGARERHGEARRLQDGAGATIHLGCDDGEAVGADVLHPHHHQGASVVQQRAHARIVQDGAQGPVGLGQGVEPSHPDAHLRRHRGVAARGADLGELLQAGLRGQQRLHRRPLADRTVDLDVQGQQPSELRVDQAVGQARRVVRRKHPGQVVVHHDPRAAEQAGHQQHREPGEHRPGPPHREGSGVAEQGVDARAPGRQRVRPGEGEQQRHQHDHAQPGEADARGGVETEVLEHRHVGEEQRQEAHRGGQAGQQARGTYLAHRPTDGLEALAARLELLVEAGHHVHGVRHGDDREQGHEGLVDDAEVLAGPAHQAEGHQRGHRGGGNGHQHAVDPPEQQQADAQDQHRSQRHEDHLVGDQGLHQPGARGGDARQAQVHAEVPSPQRLVQGLDGGPHLADVVGVDREAGQQDGQGAVGGEQRGDEGPVRKELPDRRRAVRDRHVDDDRTSPLRPRELGQGQHLGHVRGALQSLYDLLDALQVLPVQQGGAVGVHDDEHRVVVPPPALAIVVDLIEGRVPAAEEGLGAEVHLQVHQARGGQQDQQGQDQRGGPPMAQHQVREPAEEHAVD